MKKFFTTILPYLILFIGTSIIDCITKLLMNGAHNFIIQIIFFLIMSSAIGVVAICALSMCLTERKGKIIVFFIISIIWYFLETTGMILIAGYWFVYLPYLFMLIYQVFQFAVFIYDEKTNREASFVDENEFEIMNEGPENIVDIEYEIIEPDIIQETSEKDTNDNVKEDVINCDNGSKSTITGLPNEGANEVSDNTKKTTGVKRAIGIVILISIILFVFMNYYIVNLAEDQQLTYNDFTISIPAAFKYDEDYSSNELKIYYKNDMSILRIETYNLTDDDREYFSGTHWDVIAASFEDSLMNNYSGISNFSDYYIDPVLNENDGYCYFTYTKDDLEYDGVYYIIYGENTCYGFVYFTLDADIEEMIARISNAECSNR